MSPHVLIARLSGVSCLALALMASSCAPVSSGPMSRPRAERKLYGWNDDGGEGKVTVRISLSDQIAQFKRGDREIGWCYVATGKEGHSTAAGSYTITEKIEDKYSNRYGWFEDEFGNVTDNDAKYNDKVPAGMVYKPAPMPYWMRLTSYGIGMHGGIIPLPGEPASHGCIRIPKDVVPRIFEVVKVGTPVVITHAPSNREIPGEALPQDVEFTRGERPPAAAPNSRAWSGGDTAESVTYRNGRPVF